MSEFTLRHSSIGSNLPNTALDISLDAPDEEYWKNIEFLMARIHPYSIPHQLNGYDPDAGKADTYLRKKSYVY